jgi:hypothetical protein
VRARNQGRSKEKPGNAQIPRLVARESRRHPLQMHRLHLPRRRKSQRITPTTDTTALALVPYSGNAANSNSEGLLDGVISPHQSRTDEQHEVMHREIVQKNAHIIDDIRSLDIYALSRVRHNLKEHRKARFRRDYGPRRWCRLLNGLRHGHLQVLK